MRGSQPTPGSRCTKVWHLKSGPPSPLELLYPSVYHMLRLLNTQIYSLPSSTIKQSPPFPFPSECLVIGLHVDQLTIDHEWLNYACHTPYPEANCNMRERCIIVADLQPQLLIREEGGEFIP